MLRGERVRSHVAIIDRGLENEFECNCEKHRTDFCSGEVCSS